MFLSKIFSPQTTKKVTTVVNNIPAKPAKAQPVQPAQPEQVIDGGMLADVNVVAHQIPEYYKNLFVILDNGHGEDTPGKRSPDRRLLEYLYTRMIVKKISERLDELQIAHAILVPEVKDISLKERVARANKIHAEQHKLGKLTILISVHCNAAGNGGWMNARGWSAWTSEGTTESDTVADCLYKAAHAILDPKKIKVREDKSDGDADYESNFYIIYRSSMPAVLVENFFQDNIQDVNYLLSEEGINDIVNIHVQGIQNYADLKFKK